MPEWNHPPLSKGAEVHSPTTLSSGDPSPGGVNISTVPRRPSMTRGRTAPPSSSEHGYKSSFDGGDMTALMEGSAAKLALDSTEDVRRWRGRSRKAKSSSPPKSRSGSPSVHRQVRVVELIRKELNIREVGGMGSRACYCLCQANAPVSGIRGSVDCMVAQELRTSPRCLMCLCLMSLDVAGVEAVVPKQ